MDPRVDGILTVLQEVGILMGRQTEERNATVAAAAEAVVAAANGANGNNGNHGNNGNAGNPGQGQVNVNRPMSKLIEQFLKLKPPRFDGRDLRSPLVVLPPYHPGSALVEPCHRPSPLGLPCRPTRAARRCRLRPNKQTPPFTQPLLAPPPRVVYPGSPVAAPDRCRHPYHTTTTPTAAHFPLPLFCLTDLPPLRSCVRPDVRPPFAVVVIVCPTAPLPPGRLLLVQAVARRRALRGLAPPSRCAGRRCSHHHQPNSRQPPSPPLSSPLPSSPTRPAARRPLPAQLACRPARSPAPLAGQLAHQPGRAPATLQPRLRPPNHPAEPMPRSLPKAYSPGRSPGRGPSPVVPVAVPVALPCRGRAFYPWTRAVPRTVSSAEPVPEDCAERRARGRGPRREFCQWPTVVPTAIPSPTPIRSVILPILGPHWLGT
ncbi:vegetative cell wall protein gp1-like [Syzygium oleosum]|uniref:vegetative cell wall protein gp1-like n=1 Tax=Syzygium oleosum TaxID=219896 RepID=UPI0024BB361E|nr:vegetative cell wall protein gp1-like [Syzygium oleosum]